VVGKVARGRRFLQVETRQSVALFCVGLALSTNVQINSR